MPPMYRPDKHQVPCNTYYYQPICAHIYFCVYVPILGSFNEWEIVTFDNSSTIEDSFNIIHKVTLDGMSSQMWSVVTHVYFRVLITGEPKE